MSEGWLAGGYPALFVLSFLAATLLPLGSEGLLVALLLQPLEPIPLVVVATLGNTLGACTTYLIGLRGGGWLLERLVRLGPAERARGEALYARYGRWSLLLSWVPLVGDPLCLAAGLLRTDPVSFVTLVACGKGARYAGVAWLTLHYGT